MSSARAVGALNTAVQGSFDRPSSASSTQITVNGAASRIGRVLGSYRLLDVLGEGGMGSVYLAEHVRLGRKVALKMLHPHYTDQPEVVRRFFAEARAVNRIFHDHIVEITDFVENERGFNYFIMEYLKGLPLGDLIDQEGAMPLSRSVGIMVQVCSALSVAHEAGIVHRDLKPDNIFITERGGQKDFVKLLDFGIAKLLDADGTTINLQTTAAGLILGTPEYMSPEQARGRPVDYRTDIYSVGVILYELATGRKPFLAETFGEMVIAHSTTPPTPPSRLPDLLQAVPRPLEELILECLEKEPQRRPQSAKSIEDRLRSIALTSHVALERFDVSPRLFGQRRNWMLFAGAAALAAAVAVAIPLFGGSGDDPTTGRKPVPAPAVAAERQDPPAEVARPDPPAAPAKVAIAIDSVPAGATVFAAGSDEPLGVTPLATELPRSSEPMKLEIRMDGFEPVQQTVSLARDAQIAVMLAPRVEPTPAGDKRRRNNRTGKRREATEPAREATPTPPKPRYKDGAVMNPFEN